MLVDFWTYSCINWRRTLPYVRAWAKKYKEQGLVVVGIHTPEVEFEKDINNVRQAVKSMKIDYPVAMDNKYAVWHAFNNMPVLCVLRIQGQMQDHSQHAEKSGLTARMTLQRQQNDDSSAIRQSIRRLQLLSAKAASGRPIAV